MTKLNESCIFTNELISKIKQKLEQLMEKLNDYEKQHLLVMLNEAGLTRKVFEQMSFGHMCGSNTVAERMVEVAKTNIDEQGLRIRPTFDYSHIAREEEDSDSGHYD
ncbi:MAG: hypothetical protein KBD10_02930 [Candidatus Pacebacteria bacterium]|nr:hypothetical protein [Candidatus Paceibacterota bacterium]